MNSKLVSTDDSVTNKKDLSSLLSGKISQIRTVFVWWKLECLLIAWYARWHHWLNGNEFEHALEDGGGQGSLACCSPWGHKESDMTEQLNNSNLFLDCTPFSLHPLSPLSNDYLNLPFGSQGSSWRLKPIIKQALGDSGRLLCPGAPQGPARFH